MFDLDFFFNVDEVKKKRRAKDCENWENLHLCYSRFEKKNETKSARYELHYLEVEERLRKVILVEYPSAHPPVGKMNVAVGSERGEGEGEKGKNVPCNKISFVDAGCSAYPSTHSHPQQ